MTTTIPAVTQLATGEGYNTRAGRFVEAPTIALFPSQTFAAGVTVGPVIELGKFRTLALILAVTAVAGTNPTLDVKIETSPDGLNDWQDDGSFAQATAAGPSMSAVVAAGTSPPTVTLTSTAQTQPVKFRMECTTLGARGTAVVRYSIDGGTTWVSNVLTAATIAVIDPNGTDTGVVINFANAASAVDNVWTATTVGYERKRFTGFGAFVRGVATVGGSATPTLAGSVTGRAH